MIFSSFTFLLYFLPIVLCCYYVLPSQRLRNFFLLAASLVFYSWHNLADLIYLFAVITAIYAFSFLLSGTSSKHKKFFLISGILCVVGWLVYFKYAGFILSMFTIKSQDSFAKVIMPLGISFYTFQAISYLIDVYNGMPMQKKYSNLALYIGLFPQLVAGPIVKYSTICKQLDRRSHDIKSVYLGFRRFIVGLSKKLIVADALGSNVDSFFSLSQNLPPEIIWIAMIFYTMQIYFDFSGYSDMAIGLGKMFGFNFKENFNYPYVAKSVSEFWRRWHISLSSWFKEYVYIPLGGNRHGLLKTCRNLLIVFLLTGIWHGANWTFIIWGLWYGIFLIIEKCLQKICCCTIKQILQKSCMFSAFLHIYVMLVVVIGWVFFRSDSVEQAVSLLSNMFSTDHFSYFRNVLSYFTPLSFVMAAIGFLASVGFGSPMVKEPESFSDALIGDIILLGLLLYCLMSMVVVGYTPFIYFNF